jgi:hypothetical protein
MVANLARDISGHETRWLHQCLVSTIASEFEFKRLEMDMGLA